MTTDAEDDIRLMRALQEGHDWALGVLMGRWKQPIANYLYRILGSHHDAAELSQEVFIKVYFNRGSFRLEKTFSSWLFTIAGNLAKNKLRWWSRHPSAEFVDDKRPAEGETPSEMEETMRLCLGKLPVELREVLVLFDVEDKSHQEIAAIIGKSAKTVASRLYKAREELRKAYEKATRKEATIV
jgi:RNA polymerase sigma-70 factor (ECF subfamily)